MKTRQPQSDARSLTLRGLRALFAAACLSAPVAAAQVEVEVKPAAPLAAPAGAPVDPTPPAPAPAPAGAKDAAKPKPAIKGFGRGERGEIITDGKAPAVKPALGPVETVVPAKPPVAAPPPAIAPAATKAAPAPAGDAAKPAEVKEEPVDPALEKEIEKLKKELEAIPKGKPAHDLKAAELKRKEGELARKVLAVQRKRSQDERNDQIATGATLETDSEVDMLLDRAREYAALQQYREACVLWQHVLNQKSGLTDRQPSASALKGAQTGPGVLRPVRDLVEMELAALPVDGLNEYRITADPEAAAVFATTGELDPAGLADVVRRYFVSSHGDDAAYRLACIKMDEWDFISARRLLEKAARHPTLSIPRVELYLRLTLANAKAGDRPGAREALASLEEAAARAPVPAELLAAIRQIVESGPVNAAATGPVEGWPMALGSPARDGVMAGAPGKPVTTNDALWIDQPVAEYDYKIPDLVGKNQMMGQPQQGAQGRQEIVTRWEKGGWQPTAQVLIHGRKAFFKTHDELRWYDLSTRKPAGAIKQEQLKLDPNARIFPQNYYYGPQKPETPTSSEEIAHFGDRVAKSMSIVGDTLFHIEGRTWMGGPNTRIQMWVNNKQTALQLTERLCAVDIADGVKGERVKWRYPADPQAQADLRFVAAPVPSGDRLLVPVMRNTGSELYLVGLEAATGKELFSTLLCMPPNDDSARWAPVGVSIVGSEAYVATGYGVIFAVDVSSGGVLWATRYKRSEALTQQQGQMIFFNGQRQVTIPGWSEDVIIPRGNKLIVLPSDADHIICFSRLTGKQLWLSKRENATYALGVLNDSLYVAGRNVLRRYGINSGKLETDVVLKFETHARGALTPQGIYLPTKTEIVRLDPVTLAPLGKLRIATTSRDPVGNVFCDGNHLVAAGLDRVYALADGDLRMKELTDSIAAMDTGALRVERAFLHQVVGKTAPAVDDLRVAVKLLPAGKERDEAARTLMLGLLDLTKSAPDNAIALFEEAEKVAEPIRQQVRIWLARGRYHAEKDEANVALDLFLKAAQDTSDALVLVDDEDGRREARASLAARAEILDLLAKLPALGEELARRGAAALDPYLELARMEQLLAAAPDAQLPQAIEVKKLSAEAELLAKVRKDAQGAVDAADAARKKIESDLAAEKTTPTGRLEALTRQLTEHEAAVKPLAEKLAAAVELHKAALARADAARAHLAGLMQRLKDLKDHRVAHADRLVALGDLYPASIVQLKAHLLAARYLWNEDVFERSELILRELSASSNRAVAAAGAVALAQGYQGKSWPRQAHQAWTQVKRDFADVAVEQTDGRMVQALDLATAALASIKIGGDATLAIDRKMPDPPYEKTWGQQYNGQYFLDLDELDPSQFLEDHLVMLNTQTSRIVCKNADTGNDLWQLSLQRSNFSGSSTTNGRIVQFNNYTFPNGRLVRLGHVAMLTAPDRVMAFGLTSGKQLWEVAALDSAARRNQNYYYGYNNNPMMPVTMGSGVVAEHGVGPDRGETQVRALDAQTGKVRWIAEFKTDQVAGLSAGAGSVFVFVNNGNETIVCDALTGKRTGRIKFENRQPHFPLAFTKHGLLAVNMSEATLYDLPTGKKKWSQPLTSKGAVFSGYQRIDMIDDDRACVLNGGLFVLDIKNGKTLAQSSATELGGRYINDAAASPDGKEIVAIGYGNQGEQTINIMDTSTGKVKAAMNLGPRVGQQIQASKVAAGGELIPVLISDPPKDLGGGRKQYTNNATIAFFRKSDGKRVDVKLPGGDSAMRVTNAQSPIVRGNVFMVLTYQSITAYRHVPGAPAETLKPFIEPPAAPEKKDDKGAELIPGLIPLPGVPLPAVRRAILPAIKLAPRAIEKKDAEKKDEKKEEERKADEKKGADAGKAGKAVIVVKEGVIVVPDIILEGGVIGAIEVIPVVPDAPAKKTEKNETKEKKD